MVQWSAPVLPVPNPIVISPVPLIATASGADVLPAPAWLIALVAVVVVLLVLGGALWIWRRRRAPTPSEAGPAPTRPPSGSPPA
jgi:uncharacterized iron-regulated membrane protein